MQGRLETEGRQAKDGPAERYRRAEKKAKLGYEGGKDCRGHKPTEGLRAAVATKAMTAVERGRRSDKKQAHQLKTPADKACKISTKTDFRKTLKYYSIQQYSK